MCLGNPDVCLCWQCKGMKQWQDAQFDAGYTSAKGDVNWLLDHANLRKKAHDVCACPPDKSTFFDYGYRIGIQNSREKLSRYDDLLQMEEARERMENLFKKDIEPENFPKLRTMEPPKPPFLEEESLLDRTLRELKESAWKKLF